VCKMENSERSHNSKYYLLRDDFCFNKKEVMWGVGREGGGMQQYNNNNNQRKRVERSQL